MGDIKSTYVFSSIYNGSSWIRRDYQKIRAIILDGEYFVEKENDENQIVWSKIHVEDYAESDSMSGYHGYHKTLESLINTEIDLAEIYRKDIDSRIQELRDMDESYFKE